MPQSAWTLAAIFAVLAYAYLRLWGEGRRAAAVPAACGTILVVSLLGGSLGTGGLELDFLIFVTFFVALYVTAKPLVGTHSVKFPSRPDPRATHSPDTRIYAGQPPQIPRVAGEEVTGSYFQELSVKTLMANLWRYGLFRYAFAIGFVGWFADTQYELFLRTYRYYHEPTWALGPLYFLVNDSPADDWIGYALLAVAVPCILSVAVWPNRWTALVASLVGWAWVIPGTVKALVHG